MSLPNEIQKIFKRIDKVAKGGKENFLQYHALIDEYIIKGSWDKFKQCLYLSYGLEVDDMTALEVKKETWSKILFKTTTTLQDQKYDLFKSNNIYNQGLGYYLEGTNPTKKLGEIKEILQTSANSTYEYQTHRFSSILDPKRTLLEVTVNQDIPESFISDYSWSTLSITTQSDYLQDPLSRERIQSGLAFLDADRGDIHQIMSDPDSSLSIITDGYNYIPLFNHNIEIDFQFSVFPQSGTGSFFVSIFNYRKSLSKMIPFSVGSQSYTEYFYTGGNTFSVVGNKNIDVNVGDILGISVYKDSSSDISFNFSDIQIDFISSEFREYPTFLTDDDIDWIKNNNSFRISQSSISTATASQKHRAKVIFSTWDDEKTYDKNMINLYNQAILHLINPV